MLFLNKQNLLDNKTIKIGGSKSISNRLLILNHLFFNFNIENLSDSKDTEVLQQALNGTSNEIDIHHAGTAMRFLTSYFAISEGREVFLTGSSRMKERPIKDLVTALQDLGANIAYLEKEGYPPLKINGKKITKNSVTIKANISSQYITSLMLIGGKLPNGLTINLQGKMTSRPYLEMTRDILNNLGISCEITSSSIKIEPFGKNSVHQPKNFSVESDWSSASYFYSLAAIGRNTISLQSFKQQSLQGDSILQEIFESNFGLKTIFSNQNTITLEPIANFNFPEEIILDLNDAPDIAQTICVTATALQIPFKLNGLATLKVKETDRLEALKNELLKIGCHTEISENSIKSLEFFQIKEEIYINTYNDHRMAMSFAPYSLLQSIYIENPEVVEKSYPAFWLDLNSLKN